MIMSRIRTVSRREFCRASVMAAAGSALLASCRTTPAPEPIIDIHQHTNYGGKRDPQWRQISPARNDAELAQHQRNMGVTPHTVLMPRRFLRSSAPRPMRDFPTDWKAPVWATSRCRALAQAHPGEFYFAASEVPDLEDAPQVIEKFLKARRSLHRRTEIRRGMRLSADADALPEWRPEL